VRAVERRESRAEFARAVNAKAAELGENVACDASTVRRWEEGEITCPGSPISACWLR
jgi:hypothetical protein